MRKKIGLMIIAFSLFLFSVAGVYTMPWQKCQGKGCPNDSACRGDFATTLSKCKIQCWAFGGWSGSGPIWHKAGIAFCGEGDGDDGKPPVWPEL